jgi:hypothetical protein
VIQKRLILKKQYICTIKLKAQFMRKSCELKEKPKSVRAFFTSRYFWKPFLSVFLGGVAGYLFYHFVGCKGGSCAITGNPLGSIIFGSLLGLFVVNSPCRSRS